MYHLKSNKRLLISLTLGSLLSSYSLCSFADYSTWSGTYLSVGAGNANTHLELKKIASGTPPQYFLSGSPSLTENGTLLSIAIGHDFNNYGTGTPIRSEIAYNHFGSFSGNRYTVQNNGGVNRHFNYDSNVYFWNTYWDFNNISASWAPFIGFGLGVAENTGETTHDNLPKANLTKSEFAWNISTGLNLNINPQFKIGAIARYTDLGKINFGQINGPSEGFPVKVKTAEVSGDLHSVDVMATLTYTFA